MDFCTLLKNLFKLEIFLFFFCHIEYQDYSYFMAEKRSRWRYRFWSNGWSEESKCSPYSWKAWQRFYSNSKQFGLFQRRRGFELQVWSIRFFVSPFSWILFRTCSISHRRAWLSGLIIRATNQKLVYVKHYTLLRLMKANTMHC